MTGTGPLLRSTPRVVFSGPFPTGFMLDTQSLAHGGYENAQSGALRRLGAGWTAPGGGERTMEFDVDNYGGRPLVPLYFLEQSLGSVGPLEKVEIKMFDFGVGVLTATWPVAPAESAGYAQFAAEVEAFSRTLPGLVEEAITAANREVFEVAGQLDVVLDGGRPAPGRLLWAHRIYGVETRPGDLEVVSEEARNLLLSMSHDAVQPVTCRGMTFLAGVGSSVGVHLAGSDPRALQHAIELQNAYWAAGGALDRELFRRLTALSVETRGCSLGQLDERSMEIVALFERVRVFRTILNSLRGALSPLQAAAWGALSEAWRLDELLSAVDDKLDTLQTLYERLRDEAAAERDTRINRGVVAFTALSLIGTLLAAYDFVMKPGKTDLSEDRLIFALATLALAALAAVVLLTRESRIKRS